MSLSRYLFKGIIKIVNDNIVRNITMYKSLSE